MSRILIVEDEQHIADGLRFNLEAEGHEAAVAADGEKALALLLDERRPFDVVILDVMLPGTDGFTVATELRAAGHYEPILMLTARDSAEDVLRGFEAGADDYLPKPFELSILLARVNGLLRRHRWNKGGPANAGANPSANSDAHPDVNPDLRSAHPDANPDVNPSANSDVRSAHPDANPGAAADAAAQAEPGDVYTFAGRTLDFAAMEVRARDRSYRLTLMECDLLRYLVKNAGQPVSRRAILQEVWGLPEGVDTRAIDNFIVRLRRYIEERPATPQFLQTVRGVGYRFVPEPR